MKGMAGGLQSYDLYVQEEDTKGQSSELKVGSAISDNKKGLKSINSKRRSKESSVLILVEDGHHTNRVEGKAHA